MTITIGLSKGRLLKESQGILEKLGQDFEYIKTTRQLVIKDESRDLNFILLKPSDIPTYVEKGIIDIGIVGKDTLIENKRDVYEVMNLSIGKCRFSVAGKPENKEKLNQPIIRVATKYPNITKKYFEEKGKTVEITKLNGSVELAPLVGLSDMIVDLVETGNTLKANGLVVYEDVFEVSARLIVNKVSYRYKDSGIQNIMDTIKAWEVEQ
ncbi:MAG: ATP phosphoribosyltransferase [Clostridia bacterium]|nr:ATP phosphoribosyltransferase [Clostridia bacterium]